MPNFNHAHFLPEAIESILEQSVAPAEFIIIDDCSTDDSVEIIDRYAARYPVIRFIKNEVNRGVLPNALVGTNLATSDYLHFAAADDRVLPGLYEKSLRLLARYPEAGLCTARILKIDEEGRNLGLFRWPIARRTSGYLPPAKARAALLRHGTWLAGNSAIYRRSALLDEGGFRPELGPYCDGFLGEVLALRHGACYIPEALAAWRLMAGGYASSGLADYDRAFEVLANARRLMETEYADLFPSEYVADFERQYLYWAGLSAWRDIRAQQNAFVERGLKPLVGAPVWTDRAFDLGLQGLSRVQHLAVAGYLLARVRLGGLPPGAKLRKLAREAQTELERFLP